MHNTNKKSAAKSRTCKSGDVRSLTKRFRSSVPTSGRLVTSISGGKTTCFKYRLCTELQRTHFTKAVKTGDNSSRCGDEF